jgi:hypothetical protein
MNDDTRRMIYGTIVAFLLFIVLWLGFVYLSACSFTLTCIQAAQLVERTPIPTLIPVKASQPKATTVEFNNKCKVAATGLIGAWISAGHSETEPFPFTDLSGQSCEGTFADVQPLFRENSIWFPGSLGCVSCHNGDLTDRSAGLDLTSYQAMSLGSGRKSGETSPGKDIFGSGDLNQSLLYQELTKHGLTVLTNKGLATQGHSKEASPNNPIIYAGQLVTAGGEVTATPTP